MIREITFGQYYQTDSVLHKLDPRVKLVGTILYIISLFLYKEAAPFALALVFLGAMIVVSRVPFKYMVRGLKAVVVLLLITAAFKASWSFTVMPGYRSRIFLTTCGIR